MNEYCQGGLLKICVGCPHRKQLDSFETNYIIRTPTYNQNGECITFQDKHILNKELK